MLKPYCEGDDEFTVQHYDFKSRLYVDDRTGHASFLPVPGPEVLAQFYEHDYIPRTRDAIKGEFSSDVILFARQTLTFLKDHHIRGIRFAHDIGCGSGRLVWAFQQLGLTASGNEVSGDAVTAGNEFCGGALSDLPFDQVPFQHKLDLITSFHVIEHLADPLATIVAVAKNLSPHGAAYFTVPNGHSYHALKEGRRADPCYSFPAHLQYFTPKSMFRMLRSAGLEPVYLTTRTVPHLELPVAPQWCEAALLGYEIAVVAVQANNHTAKRDNAIARHADVAYAAFMLKGKPCSRDRVVNGLRSLRPWHLKRIAELRRQRRARMKRESQS